VLCLLIIVMAAYYFIARPYQLHWGAMEEEIIAPMPGDELETQPHFLATRAITIEGTPQEIWSWIVQMGYDRAGFYGYDILENIGSERGIYSADRILPEFQNFEVGDEVPISAVSTLEFYAIEPHKYIIWSGNFGRGSFLWALNPVNDDHTRLISRIRWSYDGLQPGDLGLALFTEFTDHLAIREILRGVKGRVENSAKMMARQNLEFGVYVISAFVFFTSLILLIRHPPSWARWLAGLIAGMAWLIVWYAPISLWLGVSMALLTGTMLFLVYRSKQIGAFTTQEKLSIHYDEAARSMR
jgi:hypothetical protein